ncbi:MAG: hypothetical protein KDF64_05315, partial [Geminicoccaceae bacterium]|nr:hypothetical protein [Geminicoccaceae bacterium]
MVTKAPRHATQLPLKSATCAITCLFVPIEVSRMRSSPLRGEIMRLLPFFLVFATVLTPWMAWAQDETP